MKPSVAGLLLGAITLSSCSETKMAGSQKATKEPLETADAEPETITDIFTVEEIQKSAVDIVFVVDASGSMRAEQERLRANLAAFIGKFAQNGTSLDYQLFVLDRSFSPPSGVDTSRIATVNEYVDSHDALDVLARFMAGQTTGGSLTRRPDVPLDAIIISDDNAGGGNSMNAATFKNILSSQYANLKFHLHGLVGLPTLQSNSWCGIVQPGSEYSQIAGDPKYSGLLLDLCNENWNDLLSRLGGQIANNNVGQKFTLRETPRSTKSVKVYVDETLVGGSSGDYEISSDNELTFKEGFLKPNAEIKVVYKTKI